MIKVIPAYGVALRFAGRQKFIFWPVWPFQLINFIRGQRLRWLPSFWAVGPYCCDTSPGRAYAWFPLMCWNGKELRRLHAKGFGDGDSWVPISVFAWLQFNWDLWARGVYKQRTDGSYEELPILPWREREWWLR